jgi:hypothetical protein
MGGVAICSGGVIVNVSTSDPQASGRRGRNLIGQHRPDPSGEIAIDLREVSVEDLAKARAILKRRRDHAGI